MRSRYNRHLHRISLMPRTPVLVGLMAVLLTGCASRVPLPQSPQPGGETQSVTAPGVDPGAAQKVPSSPTNGNRTVPTTTPRPAAKPAAPTVSQATTALAYRKDAATHLYDRNAHRIYQGTLPPLLYAIGVLNVEIDRRGHVVSTTWQRAPRHAPEVMAEIIRTVEAAAPYPLPAKLGRLTYTDTWLWDESGQFQLDTLTEGQR